MALKNSDYDAVMRHYDEIREKHLRERDRRTAEVYRNIPEISRLDDETASRSLEAARARIADPGADLASYQTEMKRIRDRKKELLEAHGYTGDFLELTYDCPLCRDTGYVGGRRCRCFDRAAAEIVYGGSSLRNVLKSENFDRFSFDVYSDTIKDEITGMTPRETAKRACAEAREMASRIGRDGASLYICGNTGVGKTFLAHCIADEALKAGCSVLCFSSAELFDLLAESAFGRSDRESTGRGLIDSCDLLIIDDLGAELMNAFVGTELFRIVSGRIASGRSTVISSNLSLGELSSKYSERIFSRITSHYSIIRLTGGDIRIQQKLNGGQT